MDKHVSIIGAGLSGCEAALVLARNGFQVTLYEQKPSQFPSAYVLSSFAELVCNNVFAPKDRNTPLGLLLSELSMLKSPLIALAGSSQLNDRGSLSVDKKTFSKLVTSALYKAKIDVVCEKVRSLPDEGTVILATGPLTDDFITENVSQKCHTRGYHFSDASSVVIDITTVDTFNPHFTMCSDDLYVLKLSPKEFHVFFKQLLAGKPYAAHIAEDLVVFKECQPVERIAADGEDELIRRKFKNPNVDGISLYLRRENGLENGFILSGFMTTLRHADQKRVLQSLPGFGHVQIIKYGRAHRNTYFDAPQILNEFYMTQNPRLYIIGQLSGVDGYIPCISSGYVAAQRIIHGDQLEPFPQDTMVGALAHYVSNKSVTEYSPMGPSYSLLHVDYPHGNKIDTSDYYVRSHYSMQQYILRNLPSLGDE